MEFVRTEIRLNAARILARFGQTDVQRRFPRELRARDSPAGAGLWQVVSSGRAELASGFERSHQGGSEELETAEQAKK